jgi:hypothetical protein
MPERNSIQMGANTGQVVKPEGPTESWIDSVPGQQAGDEDDTGGDEKRGRLDLRIVAIGFQRQPP